MLSAQIRTYLGPPAISALSVHQPRKLLVCSLVRSKQRDRQTASSRALRQAFLQRRYASLMGGPGGPKILECRAHGAGARHARRCGPRRAPERRQGKPGGGTEADQENLLRGDLPPRGQERHLAERTPQFFCD